MSRTSNSARAARVVAASGFLAVILYAIFAALQIFVVNPRAAAPGASLDDIYATMARAGESFVAGFPLAILATGVALALLLLVLIRRNTGTPPWIAATGYLVMIAFGAPALFIASFVPSMSLADTYGISGGDHSGWSSALYLVSACSFIACAILTLVGVRRPTPHPA
ncbi:hypothetical protein [Microbacterium xanthum]|uniref:hypothetical protein n=1 Tax=Microbacterium xanthum TaxID=3079794 RepID=UPI002AD45B02|nr:hypothetical protein [Microbacterium sp. KSW-48]MDZ8172889.1 hypothetical protein [Microbacterium sp. KSW-48]